jgi:hypothetical protein
LDQQGLCHHSMYIFPWCSAKNIVAFSFLVLVKKLVEETCVPGENHWLATSHWHTLSHYVVSSRHRLSGVRTSNVIGDIDHHDITEILLTVALNIIILILALFLNHWSNYVSLSYLLLILTNLRLFPKKTNRNTFIHMLCLNCIAPTRRLIRKNARFTIIIYV